VKRLSIGLIIGVILGIIGSGVLFISLLPGAPSQYGPRFPVSNEAVPANAYAQAHSDAVGFDVYTNIKASPTIKKNDTLPVIKSRSWIISVQQDGYAHISGGVWIECEGRLYQIGHFAKMIPGEANRSFPMSTEFSVDETRRITERVIIPDIGFNETFGPFLLP